MADRFSGPVNFNDEPTSHLRLPNVAGNVAAPALGEVWLDTTAKAVKVHISSTQTLAHARVFGLTVGDGTATSYVVTHNLNSTDVLATAFTISSGLTVTPTSITRTSANAVTVVFGSAPALNSTRVVVVG